jgi:nitrite reductase/ring-hydroxylating ferredoxin subunit
MAACVPYQAIPSGWYVVGQSDELRPGDVRSVRYFARDLVLYRTESGSVHLVDAYCPHLGAHMGDGCVKKENLVCPFHGFEYDTQGRCVAVPYVAAKPPARARIDTLPVREKHGLVLAYYHPEGAAPTWEIPDIDMEGWRAFRFHEFKFRGHPQETSENSVDLGHFGVVHDYASAMMEIPLEVRGPTLQSRYAVRRPLDFIGLPKVRAELVFEATVHGLGYSIVRAGVDSLGIKLRLLVLSTPVDESHVHLRIACSAKDSRIPFVAWLAHEITLRAYVHDVAQDVPVWSKKRYLEAPALSDGDGPIPAYRRWAKQFYPEARVSLPVLEDSGPIAAAE